MWMWEVNWCVDSRECVGMCGCEGLCERVRCGRCGVGKMVCVCVLVVWGRVEDGIGMIWDGRRLRLSVLSTSVIGR